MMIPKGIVWQVLRYLTNKYAQVIATDEDEVSKNVNLNFEVRQAIDDVLGYYHITGKFPTGREEKDELNGSEQATE